MELSICETNGGNVEEDSREYGRANLTSLNDASRLPGMSQGSQVWMSHGDTILP